MKAFIKYLHEGILAQGRGTLHCHMLIWLEGALNPNEIKDQILQKDTISTCIPELPEEDMSIPNQIFHLCSTQGVNFQNTEDDLLDTMQKKDAHLLAKKCQTHRHSKTCWKYWRGPPEPKECCFDPDEKNITLKCLDGLVNHFNASILEAMRCNTDIKFIGSGPAAKAILYYITDYITKSQLKTHIALAAMETAVHKLEVYDSNDDDYKLRAKKMPQKCAHSMISHQELSAQQVCPYLMDFEDHFTSHEYRSLYWTNFESFVEKCKNLDKHDKELEDRPVEGTLDDDKISSDNFGNLVPKVAQVMDYLHQHEKFNNICVWDFIAQVDKKIQKTLK
ncbi:hypothetical protein BDR07DRAFT_1448479 [Suillus spraguei]|nr:hypothetical protein BDR07DRAFT_1448479 [Suillus spraguei]